MSDNDMPHHHVFRPGPFRAVRSYWLDGPALRWRLGEREGQIPLSAIAAIRLHMPGGGAATPARLRIVETSGRVHWISDIHWFRRTARDRLRLGRHERREASFRNLALTLGRELAHSNPQAHLMMGPSRGEWVASIVVAGMALAVIVGGVGVMIAQAQVSLAAIAFMGMCAAYLPMLWPIIRSGGPQPFDHESLTSQDPPPDPAATERKP